MKKKGKYSWKENLISIFMGIVFIFVVNGASLFGNENVNRIYILSSFIGGILFGYHIIDYLRQKNTSERKEKNNLLTSYPLIFIYILAYIIISFLLDYDFFSSNKITSSFFIKILIGILALYTGIKGIKTRKIYEMGGGLTKRQAFWAGIQLIIVSLIILFARIFIKLFGGAN